MKIARPLAALSAVTLAVATLGSATASGARAAASSDRNDRAVAGPPAAPADRDDLTRRLTGDRTGPRQAKVRLVATTSGPVSARAVRSAARSLGFTTDVAELERLGMVTVETTAARADAVQGALESIAGVRSVRASTPYQPMWTPTDPKYGTQQKGMFGALQAPAAWDVERGAGMTIAVLDSGFDAAHPDLAANVVGTWDVVAGNTDVREASTSLAHGHGTAVASVAGAATNNVQGGIAGGAPEAKLLLVGIGDSLGDLYDDASAAGIIWAANHGADVIVMSYGGPMSYPSGSPGERAANYARSKGVILVASAGNTPSSKLSYPAAFNAVLAVGATNLSGTAQTSWSAFGSWVDVAAPGVDVPVALPLVDDTFDGFKDGYSRLDGTSFSAPLVAAQAALLKAQHPEATWLATWNAITETTKPITPQAHGTFRGGRGLVQWKAALDGYPASTAITSAVVTQPGNVEVTVTSSASGVRFAFDGTLIDFVYPLVGGTTTLNLSTWGLSGAVDIAAFGCDSSICASVGDHASITVNNPAPTMEPTLDGAVLSDDWFTIGLAAGAPYMTGTGFIADGAAEPFYVKPFGTEAYVETNLLMPGAHAIRAVYCWTTTVCDTAHKSAPVSVTVKRLHPTVTVRGDGLMSPNGDGRRESVTVDYTLDQASDASIGVKNGEFWVYGPIDISSDGPTSGTWTWNGQANPGAGVGDGVLTVEVVSTKPGDVTTKGRGYGVLTIDVKKPVLGLGAAAPTTVYPIVDGYADSTDLGAKTNEQLAAWWIKVYNSKGTLVRTLTGGPGSYRAAARWNGRSTSGAMVPAGTYTFSVLAEDVAGNRAFTKAVPITVSSKKLVLKTTSKKVSADGAAQVFYYDRTCTVIYSNARPGAWPSNSLEYVSRKSTSACPKGPKYYAITENRFTLPSAIKYSTFKISTYGGGSVDGTGHTDDVAELDYLLRDGNSIGRTITLSAPTTTHAGPTVRAAEYLVNGREVRWLSGTSNGNWYDIRDFTITWSYYSLA